MDDSKDLIYYEGLTETLKDEINRKQQLIADKDRVISSLRLQLSDANEDYEDLEKEQEIFKQKLDRLEKSLSEKDSEIESLSRTISEVNTAYDRVQTKLEKQNQQIVNLVQELRKAQKDLEDSIAANDDLRLQNQELSCQVVGSRRERRCRDDAEEIINLKARIDEMISKNDELKAQIARLTELVNKPQPPPPQPQQPPQIVHHEQTNEEMVQELYDLRAQVKTLSHRLSRRSLDEQISQLQEELKVTETSWKFERLHKERYAKENIELEKQLAKIQKEKLELEKKIKTINSTPPPPPLPPKPFQTKQNEAPPPLPPKPGDENRTDLTAGIHFSMADEEGQLMQCSSVLSRPNKRPADDVKPNYKIQKPMGQAAPIDPMLEYKLRCERAKELARRNMKTKPLHQTSYPLELDTFDTTNLTEVDIKQGKINNNHTHRIALTDSSNKRKPVKKAEAFVV